MRSRNVIDYIAWIEHCDYVNTICDRDIPTAMAIFKSFTRSASAERGRMLEGPL